MYNMYNMYNPYSWTFQFGYQMVSLQGGFPHHPLGFKDGTSWKGSRLYKAIYMGIYNLIYNDRRGSPCRRLVNGNYLDWDQGILLK